MNVMGWYCESDHLKISSEGRSSHQRTLMMKLLFTVVTIRNFVPINTTALEKVFGYFEILVSLALDL